MTKRGAPLLVDRLPLYATDDELRLAVFGARAASADAKHWWHGLTCSPNFPKQSVLMSLRYVPAVLAYLETRDKREVATPSPDGLEKEIAAWNTRKPRTRRA